MGKNPPCMTKGRTDQDEGPGPLLVRKLALWDDQTPVKASRCENAHEPMKGFWFFSRQSDDAMEVGIC
ncbi:hypothetical protein JTE90_015438 [Oedothorax gibbosus]|uniref:Uncharacterized protein n=1 Tax=Oedothorax gibbosus TaxID=931172 RepID=A0AAV6TNP1_9ARAC|nr:hypothetical protein JTE90_015438 [Oedothorax gibbosus]